MKNPTLNKFLLLFGIYAIIIAIELPQHEVIANQNNEKSVFDVIDDADEEDISEEDMVEEGENDGNSDISSKGKEGNRGDKDDKDNKDGKDNKDSNNNKDKDSKSNKKKSEKNENTEDDEDIKKLNDEDEEISKENESDTSNSYNKNDNISRFIGNFRDSAEIIILDTKTGEKKIISAKINESVSFKNIKITAVKCWQEDPILFYPESRCFVKIATDKDELIASQWLSKNQSEELHITHGEYKIFISKCV